MFTTVKTFELIGLITVNVMLAAVMSATFLSHSIHAGASDRLTEPVLTDFVEQMTSVSTGAKAGTDIFAANRFLQDHLAAGSMFKTSLTYDLPAMDEAERHIALDKKDYINNVLAQLKAGKADDAATRIETIDIAPDARHARVITTSYQRGPMPIQTGNGQQVVQVKAVSYCEQAVGLKNRSIVIDDATCTTSVEPDQGH